MIDTLRLREEAQSCGISLEQETAENWISMRGCWWNGMKR